MPDSPPIRVLSFHAAYTCRDSGVCCSSAWPIPIERDRLIPLQDALDRGVVVPAEGAGRTALIRPPDAPPDTPALVAIAGARCVFFGVEPRHHCRIHQALGHGALPLACRQFPRVTVRAPTGTSVTLSHYCPSAAALLEPEGRVTIQTDGPGFPADGEYVGLDARDHLPPLVRPGVLMDWSAWLAWEEHSVDLLANSDGPAEGALGALHTAVEHARRWQPGGGSLIAHVREAFHVARRDQRALPMDSPSRVAEVIEAVPVDLRRRYANRASRATRRSRPLPPAALRRFLAAHAFANWTAYLGAGLRAWLRSIEGAFGLIEAGFDPGEADLLLRHLADTDALTRAWNTAER